MGRREDVLKQELSALQFRLQEADERNDQLVESMGGATLPLLRQIENLKVNQFAFVFTRECSSSLQQYISDSLNH